MTGIHHSLYPVSTRSSIITALLRFTMMTEVSSAGAGSLSSTPTASTATTTLKTSRRISILPILPSSLTDLSSAQHQLQLLELENVGLTEELNHSEKERNALQSQLDSLRSSSSSMGERGREKEGAELKAAKRLLQRLVSKVTTNAEDESSFGLDESLCVDPERSMLAPSSLVLTTPGGKGTVVRGVGADLLDDIEALRVAWEECSRRSAFASVEHKIATQTAERRIQVLQQSTSEAEAKLVEKDAIIEQLNQELTSQAQRIEQRDRRIDELQHQLETLEITHIAQLQPDLATASGPAKESCSSELQKLALELSEKKSKLHAITLRNTLQKQERLIELLEKAHSREGGLQTIAHQISIFPPDTVENKEKQGDTVQELEGRILRRTEQIGSLQVELKNVQNDLQRARMNQGLMEETVLELEEEKEGLLARVSALEEQLSAPSLAPPSDAKGELEALFTTEKQELLDRVDTLTAQIAELQKHHPPTQDATTQADSTELHDALQQVSILTAENATLQTQLNTLQDTHEGELDLVRTALARSETRLATLTSNLSAAQVELAVSRETCASLGAELDETKAGIAELISRMAALDESVSTLSTERDSLLAANATLETELHQAQQAALELGELQARHTDLERVLTERTAAMEERNAEYWALKEELAELQEEAERSRHDPLVNDLRVRVEAQESALLKLKSDLSSARSTEELLNEQYAASRRRIQELESLLSQTTRPDEQEQAEMEELRTRIEEMEEELGRKAEEIEEADTKILEALKESKKYATRYTKLSGKYEGLQKELVVVQDREKVLSDEIRKLKAKTAGMQGAGTGSLAAGRKRTIDQEAEEYAEVKAVYAPRTPAPNEGGTSFTPVRRAGAGLGVGSKSHPRSTAAAPIVLGLGPVPTTLEEGVHAGMVRSSSNPSELIAARLSASPVKAVLGDKTNLAPSGTSRLSSKILNASNAGSGKELLPAAVEETKKTVTQAGAGAVGGGASDFLARMKAAQRTSTRT